MGKHGVNVVIGIPSFGMVSTYFAQALKSQQFPLVSSSGDCIVLNKPIAEARNEIVEYALKADANYIYWLDDDVIAPPDSFLKLFHQQKDIINGVYWSKSNPPMPLIFRGHLDGPYWDWHVGDLIEIDAAGSGLTLVKTDVYRRMAKELGGPWYSTEYHSFAGIPADSPSGFANTEDLYFYWKAKKLGYKVWVDTSVQAFHYDKVSNVMYSMPPNAPQSNPAWAIKPEGSKLIADIGSGTISPYFRDEGVSVSFDIREDVNPDVVCDVRRLPVPNETFDIVFSSHTLEHFGWSNVDKVLKEWSRVLKVGGELRLIVPNMQHIAQRLLEDKLLPTDFWIAWGEQDYPKNFHAIGFTPNVLRDLVNSLGIYENIMVRAGDVNGPPNPASWNLQLKATKVKNLEIDNISPEGNLPGPPNPNAFYPIRLYEKSNERPLTPEEITKDLTWLGASDKSGNKKKEELLQTIKKYPNVDSDRPYFHPETLEKDELPVEIEEAELDKKEKVNNGLDSNNDGL